MFEKRKARKILMERMEDINRRMQQMSKDKNRPEYSFTYLNELKEIGKIILGKQ